MLKSLARRKVFHERKTDARHTLAADLASQDAITSQATGIVKSGPASDPKQLERAATPPTGSSMQTQGEDERLNLAPQSSKHRGRSRPERGPYRPKLGRISEESLQDK